MTKLGRGIDKLQVNLLQLPASSLREQALAQGDDSLASANNAAFDHQEVLIHLAIMRECTHGGDVLLGQIKFGTGIVSRLPTFGAALANPVDFSCSFLCGDDTHFGQHERQRTECLLGAKRRYKQPDG